MVEISGPKRKSGISRLGDVPWGTHFCQFYETKQDLIDILIPYFKAGLENNEFCVWVTAEPLGAQEARAALKKAVKDPDRCLKKGLIEIVDFSRWLTRTGQFDAASVLRGWTDQGQRALKKGFEGLRFAGNAFRVENKDREGFSGYEAAVDDLIRENKMLALCSYSLDQCGANEILDVFRTHQFALINRNGQWIVIESSERKRASEALRESEENFRNLVENLSDVICTFDSEGLTTYVSPAVERLIGCQPAEDVGRPFSRHIHPEDIPLVQKRFGEASPGEAVLTECRVITRSGAVKWVRAAFLPIFKDGRSMGTQVMLTDITEGRLAQENLRERSARLELVHHIQNEIPLSADIETVLNQTAESIGKTYGYYKISVNLYDRAANEIEYLTGWNKTGLPLPRGHRQKLGQGLIGKAGLLKQSILVNNVSQDPDFIPYHLTETKSELVLPLLVQDHLIGVLDLQAAEVDAFAKDDIAVLESVASFIASLIDRKKKEDALQESEERYKSLFSEALDGLCLADAETGLIIDCNPTMAAMVDRERAELIGRPQAILHPATGDKAALTSTFRRHLADKAGQVLEAQIVTRTGEIRDVEIKADLLNLRGRKMLQGTFRDVTERKRAEEIVRRSAKDLQEKNDELVRFTAAVLHNLRSPLITIQTFQGYLEQDFRSQDAARIEKDLRYIRNATDKIGRLIDELLRLSRVGRIVRANEDAPLRAIVQEALDLVAGRIAGRGVRVEVTEEPVILWGDRQRLVEIFQNLVENAVKFMGDEPAPRVEIGVEQAGDEIVLAVRDNGIGIDPQVQPLLFGLFQKFNPETEGMGIGLALVRRIVEMHGGEIWVESEGPGKGATFRFTLANTRRAGAAEPLPETPGGADDR